MHRLHIAIFLLFFTPLLSAANRQADSLQALIQRDKADTLLVIHLNKLCSIYDETSEFEAGMRCGEQALALAQKLNYQAGIAKAFMTIAFLFEDQTKYEEALKNYFSALAIWEKTKNKKGIATLYNDIGNIFTDQGNYAGALKMQNDALKIREELNDRKAVSASFNNIGNIYLYLGDYPLALSNYFNSLKIKEELQDKPGLAATYDNIGIIYKSLGNYTEALKNHYQSLRLKTELKDKQGMAHSYGNIANNFMHQKNYEGALKMHRLALNLDEECKNKGSVSIDLDNLGEVYEDLENYPEALKYYLSALKIKEEIGDRSGLADCTNNLASLSLKLHRLQDAEAYSAQALLLNQKMHVKEGLEQSYQIRSALDSARGNFRGALQNYRSYILYRDSLASEETKKKSQHSAMQYEFDKKEIATKARQENLDYQARQESKKQRITIYSVAAILFMVVVFSVFLYRRFLITNSQKRIIEKQKDLVEVQKLSLERQNIEVEFQKKIIEEKQLEILDSITYAKRLQDAILPTYASINQQLPDSFLLYRPKDIVAGDFYWMHTHGNTVCIAACDCTGHGVPGALVSIVCSNALNRAVNEFNLSDTGKILDKVTELVLETFAKSEEEISDGMDISLLSIDRGTGRIQWSGANNPLWIVKHNELIEIKADKQPIGKSEGRRPFSSHELEFGNEVTLYLITDGFADQFGPTNKKLMKKKFKELLLSIQDRTMEEQLKFLDEHHATWKGSMEQTDDVTVIGIRIKQK